MALVNGRSYDYTSIVINILDVAVVGITSINYTQEQEKTNNYGTSPDPVSRGRGAVESSGSIEISMNDLEAIRDAAKAAGILNGSILGIPMFDIVVSFDNESKPVTHVLHNCEFMSDGVETSQGDTDIVKSIDIVISDINYRP